MENNDIGAPSDASLFDQIVATEQPYIPIHSDPSYPLLDTFVDLLNVDTKHFDFEMFNSPLPPPPPPTAPLVSVHSETSEKPNEQSSKPAPVGSTDGLDSGKSVVSDDLCMAGGAKNSGENKQKPRRQNVPLDASLTALMQAGPAISLARRPMGPEELAELAMVDPKKAKRILANRESAAKSKERKKRYLIELQKNVELLEIKITNLFNNICLLQMGNRGRALHVKEVRVKLDIMREEDRIKDALSVVLNGEIQGLKDENRNLDVLLSCRFQGNIFSPFSSKLPLQQFHNPPSQQHLNPQQPQLSRGHYGPNI
ncbi:hypothetical protein LR48_Vigan02g204200 [Vigna angularis]|uniref:BZIP domain-containing protein n=2 Tax=Phaseolus angularis TaxID=3914 RepID=A0A0L9TZP2_PHAAN|nr:hypothetical protein LR48_Vigan02g204200 [Vigna angularis]BAT94299.1 hypothetical protein VIGAN_08088800 [Vigna angularis var. angularis]